MVANSMCARRLPRFAQVVLSVSSMLACAASASAQCQLLIRDTFRLGDRPHGGNGNLRPAEVHDTLKDYWPQNPANGTRWLASDAANVPTWAFAASSLDPAEVDPLDPFNGTAFGEAPACALLPFPVPVGPFTISAEAVMGLGTTSATYLGFTSDPALLNNFETFGAIWMSLDGQGNWSIRANGAYVVAAGTAPIVGTLDSGWMHMELTYDPIAHTVSGRVMGTDVLPMPVNVTLPITYVGMEAHNSWNVLNNLSVFQGAGLTVSVDPVSPVCAGASATLVGHVSAQSPAVIRWVDAFGWPLSNGPQADGAVLSGVETPELTISQITPVLGRAYALAVANECGFRTSLPVSPVVIPAGSGDGNGDGRTDGRDIQGFVLTLTQTTSQSCTFDLNHDGSVDLSDLAPLISLLVGT